MMKVYNFFWLYFVLVCLCTAQTGDCCTEGDVRLVGGGNEFEGRVEVCFGGQWGTVCGASSYWGSSNAIVVCRQLFGSNSAFRVLDGFYGEGNGTIFTVTCPGDVRLTNLTECTISNQTTGCSHSQDGGVICGDPGCRKGEVRVFNNQSSDGVVMGQVELCSSAAGFRTKVCDTNWHDRDAEVVCRELGLPYASARAAGRCVFGEGRVINFYDNVNCTGAESSLNDCQPPYTLSNQNCGYAGVFCQNSSGATPSCNPSLHTTTSSALAVMPTTTMAGGTIRASVSSSAVTDPTTVTPTTSPSPLLAGILGAVGALVVVLIAIVAILIVVALKKKKKRTRKQKEINCSSGAAGSMDILDNAAYGVNLIRSRKSEEYESLDQPHHALSRNKTPLENSRCSESGAAGSINIQDNAAYGTSHIRSKKPEETSGTERLVMDPLSAVPTDVSLVYESVN